MCSSQCGCSKENGFKMSRLYSTLDKLATSGNMPRVAQEVPCTPTLPPLSRGSKNHDIGQCRPCRHFATPQGCAEGAGCNFCHHEHDGTKVLENALLSLQAKMKRADQYSSNSTAAISDPGSPRSSGTNTPMQSSYFVTDTVLPPRSTVATSGPSFPRLPPGVHLPCGFDSHTYVAEEKHSPAWVAEQASEYDCWREGAHRPQMRLPTRPTTNQQFETTPDIFHLL